MAERNAEIKFADRNTGFQIGQNSGPVTAQIHVPAGIIALAARCISLRTTRDADDHSALERAETPPLPSSNVPYRHNRHFVANYDLIKQIHEKLSEPAARIALVGLGGVG